MNDHLKRLVDLGLSEREAKLYLALIEHPGVTGSELQRLAGVPRTKVYETLQRMVERKLCVERQAGDVKRYSPVEPRVPVFLLPNAQQVLRRPKRAPAGSDSSVESSRYERLVENFLGFEHVACIRILLRCFRDDLCQISHLPETSWRRALLALRADRRHCKVPWRPSEQLDQSVRFALVSNILQIVSFAVRGGAHQTALSCPLWMEQFSRPSDSA